MAHVASYRSSRYIIPLLFFRVADIVRDQLSETPQFRHYALMMLVGFLELADGLFVSGSNLKKRGLKIDDK